MDARLGVADTGRGSVRGLAALHDLSHSFGHARRAGPRLTLSFRAGGLGQRRARWNEQRGGNPQAEQTKGGKTKNARFHESSRQKGGIRKRTAIRGGGLPMGIRARVRWQGIERINRLEMRWVKGSR